MGGTFGETGIKDGSMNWLVGNNVASSFPYFAGWMASGYFVVGDIRDLGETIYQGDGVGTTLNAVAFAPAVGDAEKTGNTLRKLADKYPGRIGEIVKSLIRTLPDSTPNSVKRVILNSLNGREGEIVAKLTSAGKTESEIWTMAKTGDGLIENYIQKNIGDFNSAAKTYGAPEFVRSKEYVVIGSSWKSGTPGDVNFVDVAKQLEKDGTPVNYCYFEGNVGWNKDINDKFMQSGIYNEKTKAFILSKHPSEIPENIYSGSVYQSEYIELISMGYTLSEKTIGSKTYYVLLPPV